MWALRNKTGGSGLYSVGAAHYLADDIIERAYHIGNTAYYLPIYLIGRVVVVEQLLQAQYGGHRAAYFVGSCRGYIAQHQVLLLYLVDILALLGISLAMQLTPTTAPASSCTGLKEIAV